MTKKPNSGKWPKGESGNPEGRRRAINESAPTSAFDILLDKILTVNGRAMTLEERMQWRIYQDATIKGKRPAQRKVLKWIEKREAWRVKDGPPPLKPPTQSFSWDPDNADAALLILGIATHDPVRADYPKAWEHLLLESWAVQAALSRRHGGTALTEADVKEIKRCTQEPEQLRWPRSVKK
jgi:hypothetical protein